MASRKTAFIRSTRLATERSGPERFSGGVSRLSDGKFTTYTIATGLASNTVASILETSDGTMWFATPNGLSALRRTAGIPMRRATACRRRTSTACWRTRRASSGWEPRPALLSAAPGGFQPVVEAPESLREQILGIAEDKYGSLWIATSNHVLRVNRDKLLRGALAEGDMREYGIADGLRGVEGVKRHQSVVTDPLGPNLVFPESRNLGGGPGAAEPAAQRRPSFTCNPSTADRRRDTARPLHSHSRRPSENHLRLCRPESFGSRARSFPLRLDGFDRGWSDPVRAAKPSTPTSAPALIASA